LRRAARCTKPAMCRMQGEIIGWGAQERFHSSVRAKLGQVALQNSSSAICLELQQDPVSAWDATERFHRIHVLRVLLFDRVMRWCLGRPNNGVDEGLECHSAPFGFRRDGSRGLLRWRTPEICGLHTLAAYSLPTGAGSPARARAGSTVRAPRSSRPQRRLS